MFDLVEFTETFQERVSRQSEAKMDQTVQGILKWLQGRYNQTNRRCKYKYLSSKTVHRHHHPQ